MAQYELLFASVIDKTVAVAVPCDAAGRVDIDSLSEAARNRYFFARTLVGREFDMPVVRPSFSLNHSDHHGNVRKPRL